MVSRSRPQRRRARPHRAAGSRGTGSAAAETRRDERRLDRRRPRQHGHRNARVERRAHDPRARDRRRPACPHPRRARRARPPAAAAAARPCAPPRCARGTRASRAVDAVPLEQAARVPRVLAEDDVGGAQLREHAQRHVLEVADRRGADDERHQPRSNVVCSCQWRPSDDSKRHDGLARDAQRQQRLDRARPSRRAASARTVRCGMIDEYDAAVRRPVREARDHRLGHRDERARPAPARARARPETGRRRVNVTSNGSKRSEHLRDLDGVARRGIEHVSRARGRSFADRRSVSTNPATSERRARHSRHPRASNPTNAAPIKPAAVPSSARTTRTSSRIGRSASRRIDLLGGAAIRYSHAATPKPPPITISSGSKMFANEPMPEPR